MHDSHNSRLSLITDQESTCCWFFNDHRDPDPDQDPDLDLDPDQDPNLDANLDLDQDLDPNLNQDLDLDLDPDLDKYFCLTLLIVNILLTQT
jgi:hypothetical protein